MATVEELRAEMAQREAEQGQAYAPARQNLNAVQRLQQLQQTGQLRPGEAAALGDLLKGMGQDQTTVDNTVSGWRGAQRGATLGLADDMAGIRSMILGDGFSTGRDASIQKDISAYEKAPGAFEAGETGGAGATGLALALLSRGKYAPQGMVGNVAMGGTGGGVFGLLQGQSDYEMAGRPPGQQLSYMAKPTAIGAGVGAAAYPVARGVGKIVGAMRGPARAATGFGKVPTRTLRKAVEATQDGGTDIRAYLSGLTPEATLADVEGNLRGTAQGLATVRGAGGQKLAKTIEERAGGASGRIKADLNRYIEEPTAAFKAKMANAQARSGTFGPMYDAAVAAPGPLQIKPALNRLKQAARNAGTDTAPFLARYLSDIETKAPNGLIDPAQLHWIRSDLSEALGAVGGPSKRNTLLSSAVKELDKVLDTIPEYAAARTGYANTFAMDDATRLGEEALRGGRVSALSPEEFAVSFNKLSGAQKDAFRAGLRRDVAGLMGTSRNAPAAAWGEFAKEWNEEKLRLVLGADADPIIKRMRSENVFSKTRGDVLGNSQTAFREEAKGAMGPYTDPMTGRQPGALTRVKNALIDDPVNAALNSLVYGGKQSARNLELGTMLSMQGPERDGLLNALIQNVQAGRIGQKKAEAIRKIIEAGIYTGGAAGSAAAQ